MATKLKLTWDSQSTDVLITIEGGTALFSNDGGSIIRRLQPGVDICLIMGPGPYSLEEEVACTITKCGFNDNSTAASLGGNLRAEGGSLTTANQMFHNCQGLTSLDVTDLNTTDVTDMTSMFYNSGVQLIDVSNFNTLNVTTMKNMFNECASLIALDMHTRATTAYNPGFNTSNVTIMTGMFQGCCSLTTLDLIDIDTAAVVNMSSMFSGCSNLLELNLDRFNTSSVTIMTSMFQGCSALVGLDLSSFDTNQVNAMTNMFYGCTLLSCISNLNTIGASNGRGGLFTGCNAMISPDSASRIALGTPTTGIGGTNWYGVGVCPPPVNPLTITWGSQTGDTSVTIENGNMEYSDNGGLTWTELIPGDHTLSTGVGVYILKECVNGSVSKCAFSDPGCSSKFLGTMEASGGAILSAERMFYECGSITSLDVTGLGMEYCSTTKDMFSNCSSLITLDVTTFDTARVTTMSGMFNGCSGITQLHMHNFSTEMVTDMSSMFAGCTLMTFLDMHTFDTFSVVDTSYMFWGCSSMPEININSFNADMNLNTTQMFSQCCSLTYLDLSSFNTRNVSDMKAMFYRSESLGCLSNLDTTAANNPGGRDSLFEGCTSLEQPDSLVQHDLVDGTGTSWINTQPCYQGPLEAPGQITDFAASTTIIGMITFTWTAATGVPTPTYDLYNSAGLVQVGVAGVLGMTGMTGMAQSTLSYTLTVIGSDNYYVRATNSEGSRDSNIAYGTGAFNPTAPSTIVDFTATTHLQGMVRFAWTVATGLPTPIYDVWDSSTVVLAGATSGDSYSVVGTENYYVKATNTEGVVASNIATGTGLPVMAMPGKVVDFMATDTLKGRIEFTWSDTTGTPTPTYDLFNTTSMVQTGLTSGDSINVIGTDNYFIIATNSEGSNASNINEGTGLTESPGTVYDFTATDDGIGTITFTWTAATGVPAPTYDLWNATGEVSIATNITSPYILNIYGRDTYLVLAKNGAGNNTNSNQDYGESFIGPTAPGTIDSLEATDNLVGEIIFKWFNVGANPAATYDLYDTLGLVQTGVTSPFTLVVTGQQQYYIDAVNSEGNQHSNTVSGTAL